MTKLRFVSLFTLPPEVIHQFQPKLSIPEQDPKKKIDSWTGLDLDLDSKQRTCRVMMGANCEELSDNRSFVWTTGNWISGVFFPLKSD